MSGSPSGLVILPNTAPLLTLSLSNSNNWLRSCVLPRPRVPRNTMVLRTGHLSADSENRSRSMMGLDRVASLKP